ncbi:MAG: DsbA family protein [Patescibacteria group bacterium]
MNNLSNWLVAVLIVALLGGGVWLMYNNKNKATVSSASTNTNTNTNANTQNNSTSQQAQSTAKLTPPVSTEDWTFGAKDAAVQLVEYGDFECPPCRAYTMGFESMVDKFPGQVSFTFRHYPLNYHPNAIPAALLAESAGALGKYWEIHNYIFTNDINTDKILEYAKSIGLDSDQMKADLDSKKYLANIEADQASANQSGVNGTPTLFINGIQATNQELSNLEGTIKSKLGQ